MPRLPKNSLKLYIGDTIKIGRLEIVIKEGYYIFDNGACFQLSSIQKDQFKYEDYTSITNLMLPKKLVKALDFSVLKKVNYKLGNEVYPAYLFQHKTT